MSLLEICQSLQNSNWGTQIRESIFFFPIIEGIHVIALGISVGAVLWWDLRLLGFSMRNKPISQMQANIFKWMMPGFTIMMITGVLLFWCQAEKAYNSIFFRIKVIALILAGVNILYFHLKTQRSQANWDTAGIPPTNARLAGLFSILLWAIIIAAGRLIAYTF